MFLKKLCKYVKKKTKLSLLNARAGMPIIQRFRIWKQCTSGHACETKEREWTQNQFARERNWKELLFLLYFYFLSRFFLLTRVPWNNIICFLAYCFPPGSPLGGDRRCNKWIIKKREKASDDVTFVPFNCAPFPGISLLRTTTYPAALNKENLKMKSHIWKHWLKNRKPKLLCTEDSKLYVLYIYPHPQKSIYHI